MSKLVPQIVTEESIGSILIEAVRVRPVVAVNEEGKTVMCCRRTAKKYGWAVEGTMFIRPARTSRRGKATPASVAALLA